MEAKISVFCGRFFARFEHLNGQNKCTQMESNYFNMRLHEAGKLKIPLEICIVRYFCWRVWLVSSRKWCKKAWHLCPFMSRFFAPFASTKNADFCLHILPVKLFVFKLPRDESRGYPPLLKNLVFPLLWSIIDSHGVLSKISFEDQIV